MTTSNPLAFTTPLPPLCSRLCAVSAIQRTCPIARTQRKSTVTELRSSAFLPSFAWCVGLKASIGAGRSLKVMCQDHTQKTESEEEHEDEQNRFVHKFDPDSDTDAFGRDPRKETQFWMGAARSVLESKEVQEAIAKHAADGGNNTTDEQRAYMDFIKSMDAEKASSDTKTTDDVKESNE